MEYRRLGRSGLQVSEFSFGSWVTFGTQVDTKAATEMLAACYEAGVNFFDNAEVYAQGESERVMGEAIANLGWSRDSYAVSTKVFWGGPHPTQRGLSRKHIFDACHNGLRRLQVDYLDLYFCHRPDLHTPIEETVHAMSDLVSQGKVMYWGTSEWNAQQITEAYGIARERGLHAPVMEQPQYNMFERHRVESEYAPLYDSFGLGTTVWSPLASGILTGKYRDGIPKDSRMTLPGYEWLRERFESEGGRKKLERAAALEDLAKDVGMSLTHLALLWCLKYEGVSTVILGASKLNQLQDNLAALEHKEKLRGDVLDRIEKILQNKPDAPHDWSA